MRRTCEPCPMKSSFLKVGHLPTLVACFAYFDLSFAVWVLLGPLAVAIAADMHLNAGDKGLMVATPVLAGALSQTIGPSREPMAVRNPASSGGASRRFCEPCR